MTQPALRPNERELATYPARRSQGFRTIPGQLLLTDQRLAFYQAAPGTTWECELSAMSAVRMSARGFNPLNGSLLPRLQIDSAGTSEYFVVNNGFAIVDAIEQAAGR